jgi:adenine-specific DNA-methyltransferase
MKVIERCLLMTTDPGDLVLDPTCGSGTTAYVAEQWGRRWITIDTSGVALALARQRLLTAKFDFYKLREPGTFGVPALAGKTSASSGAPRFTTVSPPKGGTPNRGSPSAGFVCKTVPHITLKSIAQNVALDAIFAKHQPILEARLKTLNGSLAKVPDETRQRLLLKLYEKEKREGKKAVTETDRRRWSLPREPWREWEVPFDTDATWPTVLQSALAEYRAAWRSKMDEVNACISANAEQEELVDKPEITKGVVRVSGPFTMEAVMPAEEGLESESPIGGEPETLDTFVAVDVSPLSSASPGAESQSRLTSAATETQNAEAYLDKMLRLLKTDSVRFPNNKVARFSRLEAYQGEFLHAESD